MKSAVKPSLEVTDDGRCLGGYCSLGSMNLPTRLVLKVKQLTWLKGVYTRKLDSPKFSSRLWLAQVIRYQRSEITGNV